jgi:hypothetical protein
MADAYHHEMECAPAHGIESFEVTYWADRFGVSVDQVREVLSETDGGNLNDSLLERLG